MNRVNGAIYELPKMKAGKDLVSAMEEMPFYNESIRNESAAVRLMELSELYNIYIPNQMSFEIYSKMYLATQRALNKKGTKLAIQQMNDNARVIAQQQDHNGIIGGSDSFTIIGTSGIGKSSAISRAISLITADKLIEIEEPYARIIPCMIVQCPFDSSVRGFLLEILRVVDSYLETSYYMKALKGRYTIDMLIGSVSQVCLQHICLLVVDEIQHVCNNKSGNKLVGCLTQLINASGISICMVGTPESAVFFSSAMQLARRSLGLQYNTLSYNQYFKGFCNRIFSYQYVINQADINDGIIEWLYEHSSGVISVVISLIHDAQEIAILNGKEELNYGSLNEAYQKRLSMLHDFIEPAVIHNQSTTKKKKIKQSVKSQQSAIIEYDKDDTSNIIYLADKAKKENLNIVDLLKEKISVVEVEI